MAFSRQYYLDHRKKELKRMKQYYLDHREKLIEQMKWTTMKSRYGLSHEDWLIMWKDQDGRCIICGKSFDKPSDACVDHNHETDEIRGLLCNRCNLGLGIFDDDPELMISAAEYLDKVG